MGDRRRVARHPLLCEAVLERRAFLRSLGLGTAAGVAALGTGGLGLAACSRGEETSRSSGAPTPSTTSTAIPPYDPDRLYWEQGNFRPVDQEVSETELEVTGAVPSTLSGLYVRNGSNPTGPSVHWFFGDGMVHGVRFEAGRPTWYRNRWVATTLHQGVPEDSRAGPVLPGRDITHANVSLIHHAGRLLTSGEVGWPYEVSAADLATVGALDFDGRLGASMTAHPKVDPATGDLHFFGYAIAAPFLTYHVADSEGSLVRSEQIDIDRPMMIHDFAITDRDAIFWLGPLMLGSPPDLPHPGWPFYWDDQRPMRVGVMPLGGPTSAMRWVDIDPCYVFHGMSAHREDDDIVLRVLRLSSVFGPVDDFAPSELTEWRIDTSGAQLRLRDQPLSDVNMDLPTIDRRLATQPIRHSWCAMLTQDGPYGFDFAGVNHVDLATGRDDVWDPGPLETAGEAFFVPDGDDSDEGEGWLLSFLYDRTTDRSSLGVFDAQAVADGPVARVHLPVRVPYGFHGLWLPDAEL